MNDSDNEYLNVNSKSYQHNDIRNVIDDDNTGQHIPVKMEDNSTNVDFCTTDT